MAPPAHPSRSSTPGALSRLFGSLRRRLARLLLPHEVPSPSDLAAVVVNPRGDGLWTLDRKGNIFTFGNAPEFREVPQPEPWREGSFVALACTPSGQGLWVLERGGTILSFGDAPEFRLTRWRSRLEALLLPGDLYVLTGAARYRWKHSIPARLEDEFRGATFPRSGGFSVTWRYLPYMIAQRGR